MIRVVDGPLYQWESGRKIEIELPEGITINEVHFAKEDEDVALVTKPYEEDGALLADIPNIHLQTHTKIRVYLFCRDGENGRTIPGGGILTVIPRAKPDDYIYTETETLCYQALEERIAGLENGFSELPIKTAPYYKTASTSYANAYYVNLLELEPNVLYGFKVEDTSKSNRIYLNVLCENGTAKSIVYAYGYSIIYLTKSGTQLTLRFVGANDNYLYVINISDLSTSSKVAVGIVHNPKYLPTDNTKEYTPTGNYHPATKKYVDDAKTESMTQAHSEFESLFEYASAAGAETMSFIVGGFRVTSNITNENIFTMLTADDTSLLTGYILYNDTKYEVDFATKSVYDNGATIQFPITGLYIEGSVPELRISTTEKTICAPDNGSAEGGGSDAILYIQQTCRKIATEYMYSPLVLYADNASDYENDAAVGDDALDAILRGRQILVRVPNADGGSYTAIFSPVLMYQLPNYQNKYLYLFFLRDEKQDLSSLGLTGVQLPTYGELKLLLSKEYNETPLS